MSRVAVMQEVYEMVYAQAQKARAEKGSALILDKVRLAGRIEACEDLMEDLQAKMEAEE